MSVLSRIPRSYKIWLKAKLLEARRVFVRTFLSYDAERLNVALRSLGVRQGDSVMLHSAFGEHFGFRGSIEELTKTFTDAVAPNGHLLMVSLPYRSSALEYLGTLKQFDVRNTPSMMGLVSELFRRRRDVLRSLHPTHPVLVHGPRAHWFVDEHPTCVYPCGPGTPFDRLASVDGKAVFFNVPFAMFTFFHYLEHLVSSDLPFPLYTEKPFSVRVIDEMGNPRTVTTFAFSAEAISRRRFHVLEDELRRRKLILERRVGNSRILAVRIRDAVDCVEDLRRKGRYFYELTDLPMPQPVSTEEATRHA
jgi:aminoglycoside 3-N-acetyltransferase